MRKHRQARDAARAYLCAEDQGKGEPMAEKLFAADDLTPPSCERLAAEAGVALPTYRTCLADPETDRRLDAALAWVQAACPQGLPAVWVQDRLLSGVWSDEAIEAAVRDAERRRASPAR
jgi:predicted DsbA family dithiol-disulfide isomerase